MKKLKVKVNDPQIKNRLLALFTLRLLNTKPQGNMKHIFSKVIIMSKKWNGEYISPYAEHGKKSEQVKKVTVSIPTKVLKILTDERTRRQVNNLRHATNSELLCEAFLHAYTGQPLPKDEELVKKTTVNTLDKAQDNN